MINEKNMFKFTVRKMGIQKDNNSIIPNDPSNIFEFTNKKRKMINFDDLFSLVKKKETLENNEKNNEKSTKIMEKNNEKSKKFNEKNNEKSKKLNEKSKKLNEKSKMKIEKKTESAKRNKKIKRVDFSEKVIKKSKTKVDSNKIQNLKNNNVKDIKQNYENINKSEDIITKKCEKNTINIPEDPKNNMNLENINDILLLFCINNSDNYSNKLHDMIIKDLFKFDKDPSELEIRNIENKIEDLNKEQEKWKNIKNSVIKENILEIPVIKGNERELQELEEEDNKLSKFIFLKNNMKSYLDNVTDRLNEIEQKIFNMTAQDNEMDPLILLKALTRYN